MTITQKHWCIAVIGAVSLHALAALQLLLIAEPKVEIQPGLGDGIEVGLGGDVGEESDGHMQAADAPVAEESVVAAEPVRQIPPPAVVPSEIVPEPVPETVSEPLQEIVQEPVVEAVAVEQPAAADAIVVESPAAAEPTQAVATLAHADSLAPASDAPAMPVVATRKGHSSQGKGGRGGKGGKGGRGGNGLKGYFHEVAERIDSHKEYPDEVKKQKFEGMVTVAFVIGRSGELLSSSIRKSSGNKLLDQAALDTLARSSPFPPLPKSLKRESLKISVPIAYTLINN